AIDHDVADRVRARRESTPPVERVLFVGRDAPHKNLDRLVRGFGASTFAQQGAVLTLAGVDGPAVGRLQSIAETHRARIELPGVVPQPVLEWPRPADFARSVLAALARAEQLGS